ncbi:MAG: isoleucine--tRNA ligase [Thermoplasmata archaeon]|nr:isoleucine--tRNA ligase [Thermoplasmata archaeon]
MRQVDENYSPVQLEKGMREQWDRTRIYEKVKKARESGKPYYFLDGPPYTTGSIHIGTAWNKILKDTYIRFRRMQGFQVRDQPGYDMHGLPIEVKVEQSLAMKNKKDIEEHGIDKFVNTCREFAIKFKSKMTDEFKLLGVWMDWDSPYLTVNPSYMESVWWTLKQAHDKKLLTTDLRVLPWCPRCETALAEAEIEYWDETDPSIYVKFQIEGTDDESLLIWTTTPWTIPGNLAAAVHPEFTYAKVWVRRGGTEEKLIFLEEKVEELRNTAGIEELKILETMKGADLLGLHYRHPLADVVPYQQQIKGEWVHAVVPSETVTAESTGIVHIAPGHGPDDFDIGIAHDIEPFSPVDETGSYTDDVGERYAGKSVRESNDLIKSDLVDRGAMFHEGQITHRYGHCWRCKRPVIYRITEQWFLKVTDIKAQLEAANDQIKWYPDWAGSSREKDWIANARDWCISRQRYWGTPVPIWRCACGNVKVISSIEELKSGRGYVDGMDVHRPWIDNITFDCEKCGQTMTRTPDVLDVWFDAGVCSWASLGYPASKDDFDKWWPSEWVTEAHDQTRGWFYSQLVTGVVAFGRSPYNSVLMHGWALTPQGEAMSKSEGTAIDPIGAVNTLGADALRLYLLKANAPWEDILFQTEGVKAANRTINIFWNVYKFAVLYMSIDKFDESQWRTQSLRETFRPEDRWMLSRIETMKRDFTQAMEIYEVHRAARILEDFIVTDLSRWYVKVVRDRLWKEGDDRDKTAAFKVLHEALSTSATMLAPIAPHVCEAIYTNLNSRPESVHMVQWPAHDPSWIDEGLEEGMDLVREISEVIARIRQEANVNLRWPLKRIIIKPQNDDVADALIQLKNVILSQNNIKDMHVVPVGEEWDEMVLSVVPNPNAIGKVYRQWSSKIAVLLKNRPAKSIKAGIDKGEYSLGIEGQLVKILPNMVSFTSTLPPDVVSDEFSKGLFYVDLEETPALEAEGFARETIRRIQQMRKDMGLNVEEFIRVEIECSRKIENAIESWKDHISRETRAKRLEVANSPRGEYIVEWNVSNEQLLIGITSLKMKKALDELGAIPGMTAEKALKIFDHGYTTIDALKNALIEDIASIDGVTNVDAKKIHDHLNGVVPTEPAPAAPPAPSVVQATADVSAAPSKNEFIERLKAVPGITASLADQLYRAGFVSDESIRNASVDDMMKVDGISLDVATQLLDASMNPSVSDGAAQVPPKKIEPGVSDLERSFSYLVEEERPETSYSLFVSALNKGMKGYCVTRNYPAKIRTKFDLKDTPLVWLSNVGRENAIRPKDLEKLSVSLEQFLSQPGGGIVLLDGLEYLITNNNFITVLRLIQSLRDQVAINQSILLMAVNKSTLESHQLNLLEREVDYTITG